MVNGNVSDFAVATEQERTLPVNMKHFLFDSVLERIQTPATFGLFRFWRLVVLDDDALERVRVCSEFSRQLEVGLLLFFHLFLHVSRVSSELKVVVISRFLLHSRRTVASLMTIPSTMRSPVVIASWSVMSSVVGSVMPTFVTSIFRLAFDSWMLVVSVATSTPAKNIS